MSTGREADYAWASNVPSEVKNAWLSAISSSKFRINTATLRLRMGFTDAAAPGPDLFDVYAAGGYNNGFEAQITLRASDDLSLFGDEVLHALGHVIFHQDEVDGFPDQTWSECFTLRSNGRQGTAADWQGDSWANSTSEAIAEFFKDVYRAPRKNNNRTNWAFDPDHFKQFQIYMSMVTCPPTPG